jgi:hypothetical protein
MDSDGDGFGNACDADLDQDGTAADSPKKRFRGPGTSRSDNAPGDLSLERP